MNGESGRIFIVGGEIKSKTAVLRSRLCNYSNASAFVKVMIATMGQGADASRAADRTGKYMTSENCALCPSCIKENDNTPMDNVKGLDVVMPINKSLHIYWLWCKASGSYSGMQKINLMITWHI